MTASANTRTDIALLLLRCAVGVTFLLHGLQKVGDIAGTQESFAGLGIPLADVMAPFVAFLEVGGGIALILGVLTPVLGLALAGNMLVATLTAHTGSGFFVSDGGFELTMLLGVGALALAAAGAGRLSLDGALSAARTRGETPRRRSTDRRRSGQPVTG